MREFFQPFRRKLGVVTLLMACALMALWMRGFLIGDSLLVTNSMGVVSCRGSFAVAITTEEIPVESLQTYSSFTPREFDESLSPVNWRFRLIGFGSGDVKQFFNYHIWMMPHWALVVPMTSVSAWLILREPRPPKRANHA